ncbi:MAG: hypothetical protein ACHQ1G_06765 [Planctomycetota bacterium]
MAARQHLGVAAEATAAEILEAYGRRSRRLKAKLMEARTVEGRDRARRALKNLVIVRDLALGPRDARELKERRAADRPVLVDDWWRPEDGLPTVPDRAHALRWLSMDGGASPATIRRVLDARARQIKLRIASAKTEYDLHIWQQTLLDLRRLATLALSAAHGEPYRPPDIEDTMTEVPS